MDDGLKKRKDSFRKYMELLTEWQEMDSWMTIVDRDELLTRDLPIEMIDTREREYFEKVGLRIRFCEALLPEHGDESLLYYTLAELYDRCNLDDSLVNLYKRRVRYYCKRTLQIDPGYSRAWALMAEIYSWITVIFGVKDLKRGVKIYIGKAMDDNRSSVRSDWLLSKKQHLVIKRIERAIYCIRQAIKIEPKSKLYKNNLQNFYCMRNQEYVSEFK